MHPYNPSELRDGTNTRDFENFKDAEVDDQETGKIYIHTYHFDNSMNGYSFEEMRMIDIINKNYRPSVADSGGR